MQQENREKMAKAYIRRCFRENNGPAVYKVYVIAKSKEHRAKSIKKIS